MACVDVETPSVCGSPGFRSGLQVCLQERRSQEQLFQQDIMRCLKTPAASQKQIPSLETTRTESVLKQKLKRRPARSELVRLILEETQAEVSHQAAQLKLKRVWLADRQSENLALHTGALELLKNNTQPIDSAVKEGHSDGGDALSPEQMTNQRPLKADPEVTDVPRSALQTSADFLKAVSINKRPVHLPVAAAQISTRAASPAKVGTTMNEHSLSNLVADRSQGKKVLHSRPKVRKLKYHQYVPPDQKPGPSKLSMDTSHGHLLPHHQQLLIQLLNQQQHFSYQAIPPAPLKSLADGQKGSINEADSNNESQITPTVVPHFSFATRNCDESIGMTKNLCEMKVSRLRQELKLRRLPVSGTKAKLIERLLPFQGCLDGGPLPGVSESASPKPASLTSPSCREPSGPSCDQGEPDERLREKERQIEELTRRLQLERHRVEELRKQLERVESRDQRWVGSGPTGEEERCTAGCRSSSAPTPPVVIKPEDLVSNAHPGPPGTPPDTQIQLPVSATSPLRQGSDCSQQVFPACSVSSSGWGLGLSQSRATGTQIFPNGSQKRGSHSIGSLHHALPNGPIYRSPSSSDHTAEAKDPPCYEEAVKQKCSMQAQVPIVSSQPMDDLFDLLIESGDISPSVRYRQPSTAIISTLPVCSALSRPPRQIHLAPPTPTLHSPLTPDPRLTPKPIPIPVVLPSEKQLEVFLEETLSGRAGAGAQTLHCPLLDSPVEDVPSLGPEFELHVGGMGMEWLELPMMDGHREALGPDSLLPVSILPADLLDVPGFLSFQLH